MLLSLLLLTDVPSVDDQIVCARDSKGGAGQQWIRRSLSLNLRECAHGLPILSMDCLLLESISPEGRFGKDRNRHSKGVERSMASRIGKLATAARFSALPISGSLGP